jgi:hypothetical protein
MLIASMTALVASGWSACRVGLTPTGKRRLSTAHTQTGHPRRAARNVRCSPALRLVAWMLIGVKTGSSMDAKSGHGR